MNLEKEIEKLNKKLEELNNKGLSQGQSQKGKLNGQRKDKTFFWTKTALRNSTRWLKADFQILKWIRKNCPETR